MDEKPAEAGLGSLFKLASDYGVGGTVSVAGGTVKIEGSVRGANFVVSMSVPSGAIVVLGLTATVGSMAAEGPVVAGQLLLEFATREPSI